MLTNRGACGSPSKLVQQEIPILWMLRVAQEGRAVGPPLADRPGQFMNTPFGGTSSPSTTTRCVPFVLTTTPSAVTFTVVSLGWPGIE